MVTKEQWVSSKYKSGYLDFRFPKWCYFINSGGRIVKSREWCVWPLNCLSKLEEFEDKPAIVTINGKYDDWFMNCTEHVTDEGILEDIRGYSSCQAKLW